MKGQSHRIKAIAGRFLYPAVLACACILFLYSCKKYEDVKGGSDPRLVRPYCNDPEAVNYNWNFPGTPDNSVCFYPTDVFKGKYLFTDSIYSAANALTGQRNLVLQITALSRTQFTVKGFCGPSDSLHFTAGRYFRATGDTTIVTGQALCRPQDTLSGYITGNASDTSHIQFFFTVVSDTGVAYHQGTAVKQ